MLEAAVILERIDAIMAELAALRAAVAASMPAKGNGLDTSDDFAPEHLIEISTAVGRFNRPADTLRWLCRTEGYGRKIQGRWMISAPMLARRLKRE